MEATAGHPEEVGAAPVRTQQHRRRRRRRLVNNFALFQFYSQVCADC